MNPFSRAWQSVKSWGQPQTSGTLLQVLSGMYARDGEFDALDDVVRVATIYRAVNRIAYDMASAPIVIERKRGSKWVPLDEDSREFGKVAMVFKDPNRHEGRTALRIRQHQSDELTGGHFLLTDYENAGAEPRPGQPPKQLRVLRADCVTRVFDERSIAPVAYRYTGDRGRVLNLRPDEVLDHRFPHPREDWCGLSPARAVQIYTKIEDELADYQRNFIRQGARGSVVLEYDTVVTKEQAEQVRQEWGTNNSGTKNAGGIWITGRGGKARELNGRRDTDFVDLFRIIKEQVGSTFGVPPAFLGDYEHAALANIDAQTPIYLEGTLQPKGVLLEENLTEILLPRFDPQGQLRARLDWNRVPMVQRMLSARMISVSGVIDKVITREEARVSLGMEADPTLGEFREAPDPFAAAGGAAPPPSPAKPAAEKPPKPDEKKAVRRLSAKWIEDPARNEKRMVRSRSIASLERAGEREIKRYFTAFESRVISALGIDGTKAFSALTKAEVDDLFDEDSEIAVVEGIVARLYTVTAESRGREAMREAGFDPDSFNINDPRVQAFITENAYINGRRIVGTTAERLRLVLAEAASGDQTLAELANEIRDLCAVRRHEAATIARTETVRAYNASSVEAWKQTGVVERIEWLTAHDDAVRDAHRDIDGEKITLGTEETFTLVTDEGAAYECKFPGDPSLPAELSVNCRCTLVPLTEDDGKSATRVARGLVESLLSEKALTPGEPWKQQASMNGTVHV